MSEQDPWNGRYRRDPTRPPEEADEPDDPSSSVFSRPTRPAYPPPQPPASDRTMQYPAGQYPAAPQPAPSYPTEQGWAGPTQPQYPTEPVYDDPYGSPGGYPTPHYPNERSPGPHTPPAGRRPPPTVPRRSAERRTDRYAEPPQKPSREPSRERRSIGFPFGAGAFFGVVGLGCFLAALMVLPWFEAGGQEVTLSDIRSAFTIPETQPEDILPGSEAEPPPAEGPIPTPGEVTDAVEDAARDAAAQAAASAIDTGKARYLELYVERLWFLAAVGVGLAVLFSTVLAPRSFALGLLLGFRRLSGVVTVFAGLAHGAALWIVFSGDGPAPAFGVWLGVVGLGSVFVGCIVGPKR